ncbi:uncharacterized protein G2W53_040234 [Senna tora]|uniref:Uncharacterized protein n=1 Tax=Senna tora TaxID=362788 RepID=A0A834SP30_9FABA|nr:uncharacterized protein G2W53_040234 [Senna tora]
MAKNKAMALLLLFSFVTVPYLWELSWMYAADPQGLKMLKSGLRFVHNS